jgi:putative NIF3 family GTP cyclohydrolase 1 type 2
MLQLISMMAVTASLSAPAPSVTVEGQKTTVRTPRLTAVFDGPALVSVKMNDGGQEFIHPELPDAPVDLFYLNGNTLGQDKHQQVTVQVLSEEAARVVVEGADSKRWLLICVDERSGDVRLRPGGMSARRGLRSVGWRMRAHPEAEVILPVVNGMIVKPGNPHPAGTRFPWPFKWEAQLAIVQRGDSCLMVHSEDTSAQFKALRLGREGTRTELCFESEPTGPLWQNRTAGGIEWRLNVYAGDWKVPAGRYRDWMRETYSLEKKRRDRPAWVDRVTLAVCWAAVNEAMLDALAAVHPPDRTLIHLSGNWRPHKYDVEYPDYTPTEEAVRYAKKAREMGFHLMPHFNYFAVYMKHPIFQEVQDFQIRSVDQNRPEGWYWPPETYDYTRMAYIHPGCGLWRNKLTEVVLDTCGKMETDVAFIDQTLCTWNTDNGRVEGLNTVEGMETLQEEFAAIEPGLVLVGEGLNEKSFQRQAFAQAHIHDGWGKLERKHVEAAHPICQFLWEGHTRLIGYYHLRPGEEGYELGVEVYERMNALPTIITGNPADLKEMSEPTRRIFERARKLMNADTRPAGEAGSANRRHLSNRRTHGMIARDIDDHMRRTGTWVNFTSTCDTFKCGDPETPVQAIAVSWMSTQAALEEAHRRGCNLFITHEPTFYSHMDDDPAFDHDECTRTKRAFLDRTGMVVYRCHDVWDRMPEHGILDQWGKTLGLDATPATEEKFMRVVPIPPTRLGDLARRMGERTRAFGQEAVLLVGDADRQVSRVGIGTGAITSARDYHRMGADVGIVTELTWWRDARWARDTGLPLLVMDHTVSEEPGMIALADYLREVFPGVRVEYIPTNCPYQVIAAGDGAR